MATIVSSGTSSKLDSFAAGREASNQAYYRLGRNEPDLIIIFASTIFEQKDVIKGVRSIIKEAPLIGCSSPGTITLDGAFMGSVSVFIISSDSISFSLGAAARIGKNSRLAGLEASKQALSRSIKDRTTKAYILLSDSLSGNGADILRGAQEVLGTSFPIIGGASADELNFQKTYQYLDNSIYTDSVVSCLVSGHLNVGIGKGHGWKPIGKPHKVTRAKVNIIKEIDKKPAIDIYENYFEKTFDELKGIGIGKLGISYPLGTRIKENNEYLIRAPLRVEDNGNLIMSAEIPEGESINLMMGDKNLALEAARAACMEAFKDIQNPDVKFITVFSNIGRYRLLRKESQKEINIIKRIFGENVPILGFYTYGEYASLDTYGYKAGSNFHSETISIAVFSE